jgi:hypothetical protein
MKRMLVLCTVAALTLPTVAVAKGPSGASIDGPGTGDALKFSSDESGGGTLGTLTEQTGIFPALFGQTPDPMQKSRPQGDLGPRYTITWTVPTGEGKADRVKQDVYPYATPPLTYMAPGQEIFDTETRGGWFRSDEGLKQTLVAAGLPTTAPSSSSSDSSFFSTGLVSLFGAALLLAMATTLVMRRRARPAAA